MPHRAQRRRNQENAAAILRQQDFVETLPARAEEVLGIRRDFVAEAIKSQGLVGLSIRPRGMANYLEVYGGCIDIADGRSGLSGDSIVNNWSLPSIRGFNVRFEGDSALISSFNPNFSALDVSHGWIRTVDQLGELPFSASYEGQEEHIVMTGAGFSVLAQTVGDSALGASLRHIADQRMLFPQSEQQGSQHQRAQI